ncbi:MAG: Crp/Fnr family transcriptional regulator [Cytophagaceae bacterium]
MKVNTLSCESCQTRKNSLFTHCKPDELSQLSNNKNCITYKKGQIIFHEGSKPFGVYCLNAGKVKLCKSNSEGKEQIVRLAKPGDFIGYRAFMADSIYSGSAVAMEESTVCFIPREEFEKLVGSNKKFSLEFMKQLSSALGLAEERLAKLAMKPVRERIAEALVLLNSTYNPDHNPAFEMMISREDLASLVGTAKETAIRFLSELKEENIIATHGSAIKVIDMDKLIKISNLYD